MSSSEFDIIFRGDIVFGHQLADVKVRLQQLFKTDPAKIDALFTGRPVPLKRNLDEATASKYRDALLKAGAMVEICPSDNSPANAPVKPPIPRVQQPLDSSRQPLASLQQPPPRPSSSPQPVQAPANWTLAPVGADLLPASERPASVIPVSIDVSGLSLRPADGNLIDASESGREPGIAVVAPDLGLEAVGADLIRPEERQELPGVEVDFEDWGLAAVGTDLLTDDERPVVLPVAVANSDFGLAPAGSDLGQLKPNIKPLAPDTSKLRLAE